MAAEIGEFINEQRERASSLDNSKRIVPAKFERPNYMLPNRRQSFFSQKLQQEEDFRKNAEMFERQANSYNGDRTFSIAPLDMDRVEFQKKFTYKY